MQSGSFQPHRVMVAGPGLAAPHHLKRIVDHDRSRVRPAAINADEKFHDAK
jgi:hypothetical protein